MKQINLMGKANSAFLNGTESQIFGTCFPAEKAVADYLLATDFH